MLRITTNHPEPGQRVLKLEGRLGGPWIEELDQICRDALAGDEVLTLDLSGVGFVEPDGTALLHRLAGSSVVLADCPPFVAAQLQRDGHRE